ncbi:TIGR01906 family membrane protein [Mordavella massiliensis]|uniref:TIGR01906 family membrane protein n=2 Tax=Mordavella massiliensis TaxID=1871024 RepID=A0A938X0M5_9CLOT|nr:TIGR01906 family membrane protein [Mordavella massiliensis]MBM6825868.1 TIGR01906 family membrane protein [Mordavella massiliensis]
MFCVIIAMLITSFQIAIYGDPDYRFYQKEYEKYQVTESLYMDMEDVMEVTSYMMDYLIGKEEVLSIETEVEGRTQDFFNEQDRLHMEDVKNLFLGGLKLRTVMLLVAAVLVLFLILTKADLKKMLTGAYFAALGVFAILIAGLLVSFAVDFTASFTVFHEIFFTNDLWMFDPAEDYMIRMLPEGFFYDMVMRIGAFFVGGLMLLFAVMMAVRQKAFWKYRGKTGEK